jgi:hypothetical protein
MNRQEVINTILKIETRRNKTFEKLRDYVELKHMIVSLTIKNKDKNKYAEFKELRGLIKEMITIIQTKNKYNIDENYLDEEEEENKDKEDKEDLNKVNKEVLIKIKKLKTYFYYLYSKIYLDDYELRLDLLWVLSRSIDDVILYYTPHGKQNNWVTLYLNCFNGLKELCPDFVNYFQVERNKDQEKLIEELLFKYNFNTLRHELPECLLDKKISNINASLLNDDKEEKIMRSELENI